MRHVSELFKDFRDNLRDGLSAILLLSMVAGATLAEENALDRIPEKLKNYTKNFFVVYSADFFLDGRPYHANYYDVDGDFTPDAGELFPYRSGKLELTSKFPLCYWFDLNQNGKPDKDEFLVDEKMDGLGNGNERWFDEFSKEEQAIGGELRI